MHGEGEKIVALAIVPFGKCMDFSFQWSEWSWSKSCTTWIYGPTGFSGQHIFHWLISYASRVGNLKNELLKNQSVLRLSDIFHYLILIYFRKTQLKYFLLRMFMVQNIFFKSGD